MALIVTSIRNKEPGQVNCNPKTPLRKTNGPSPNPSRSVEPVCCVKLISVIAGLYVYAN